MKISRIWTKIFVQIRMLNRNSCSIRELNRIELFNMFEIQFCGHASFDRAFSCVRVESELMIRRTFVRNTFINLLILISSNENHYEELKFFNV
jgi:hypothetical protein